MVNTWHWSTNALIPPFTIGEQVLLGKTNLYVKERLGLVVYLSQLVIRDADQCMRIIFKVGVMELVKGEELPYKELIDFNMQDIRLSDRQICLQVILYVGQDHHTEVNIMINMPLCDFQVSVMQQRHV